MNHLTRITGMVEWNMKDLFLLQKWLVKSKTMLTHAQHDKIRKENAQRAQAKKNRGRVKEGKRKKGQEKEAGVQRGKGIVQWEEEAVKRNT